MNPLTYGGVVGPGLRSFNPIRQQVYGARKCKANRCMPRPANLGMRLRTAGGIQARIKWRHKLDELIIKIDEILKKVKEVVAGLEKLNNPKLSISVDDLKLSVRASNVMCMNDIKTVADIIKRTPNELLKTRNCGNRTLREIEEIMCDLGFRWGRHTGINGGKEHL